MEKNSTNIEQVIKRTEQFSKDYIELLKLRLVDKTADVSSMLLSRLLFLAVLCIFFLTFSIAAALWLGEVLGKDYYGFLTVSAFYGLAGFLLWLFQPKIKSRINNSFIKHILN